MESAWLSGSYGTYLLRFSAWWSGKAGAGEVTDRDPQSGADSQWAHDGARWGEPGRPSAHLVALAGKRVDGAPAGQVFAPTRVVVRDLLRNALVHVPVDGMACRTHGAAHKQAAR
jgi:hypothetical protein